MVSSSSVEADRRPPTGGGATQAAPPMAAAVATCALDLIGATYIRDVEPGEVLGASATILTS